MKHSALPPEPEPAIPDDNAPLPPARPGTRWTVRRGRTIAFVLVGLALAVSLLSVLATYQVAEESGVRAAAVEQRLAVLEQDLAERRKQRDQENAEVRAYLCSVLDQLPADTPTLNDLRGALQCTAPGLPALPQADPPALQPEPPSADSDAIAPLPRAEPASPAGPQPDLPAGSSAPPPLAAAPLAPPATPAPPPTAPPARGLLGSVLCALPILC